MATKTRNAPAIETGVGATEMLREDHEEVKGLFEEFKKAKDSERKDIAERALKDLIVHSYLEEEFFYPAARREIEDESMLDEAAEEHHVVELLIRELADMRQGPAYEAKFNVMAENVKHHIEMEESRLFQQVEKSKLDLSSLGRKMAQRKQEILSETRPSQPAKLLARLKGGGRGKMTSRARRHARKRK